MCVRREGSDENQASGLINTEEADSEASLAPQKSPPSFPNKQEGWALGSDALAGHMHTQTGWLPTALPDGRPHHGETAQQRQSYQLP